MAKKQQPEIKKPGKPGYVMSQSEMRALREEASGSRAMLKQLDSEKYGEGNSRAAGMDRQALEKQARQLEKIASSHAPEPPRGADKDRLAKRANELREELKSGMCSKDEMNNMRKHPNAPYKNLDWERRNAQKAYEYKQVMRRLEPGDPGAGSIERFRR